jgi:hypothetical protein
MLAAFFKIRCAPQPARTLFDEPAQFAFRGCEDAGGRRHCFLCRRPYHSALHPRFDSPARRAQTYRTVSPPPAPAACLPFVPVAVPTPKGLKLSSPSTDGQGHGVCARRPRMAFHPSSSTPKGSNRVAARLPFHVADPSTLSPRLVQEVSPRRGRSRKAGSPTATEGVKKSRCSGGL